MPDLDSLVYQGGAVKAVRRDANTTVVTGPAVIIDPDDASARDFEGEYFAPDTNFGAASKSTEWLLDGMFHHGVPIATEGEAGIFARELAEYEFPEVKMTRTPEALLGEIVFDRRNKYERMVADWAEAGKLGWSTSARPDLVRYRKMADGRVKIVRWAPNEVSLTPEPCEPRTRAVPLKSLPADFAPLLDEKPATEHTVNINVNVSTPPDTTKMAENPNPTPAPEPQPDPPAPVPNPPTPPAGFTAEQVSEVAAKAASDAVKAYAESQRPTTGDVAVDTTGAPAFNQHTSDTARYDSMETADLSMMIELQEAQNAPQGRRSEKNLRATTAWEARKALALRLHGEEGKNHPAAREAMKSVGLTAAKANELNYSTQASYGDEWAGTAWSDSVWDVIRQETAVIEKIPQFEFPQGAESMTIPLTGADPIWYKVPQATSTATVDHGPSATVPPSKLGTDNEVMTLAKLGARTLFTGELDEDSVRPFMSEIRRALAVSGSEYLESVVIDGDTDATASTNINDIAGTPASTDYFLAVNGFRKLALVTNTANSRAGGVLTSSDYLETVKMLGANGANARDMSKVGLIQTAGVMWKALELTDVKTRDVFNGATIESGRLTRIYGYDLIDSQHAHLKGPFRQGGLAQVADGKIDQDTAGDNISGSIIAVRWDQWRIGWRRRMTIETQRIARADTTEIVAMFRFGLLPRDTEASAISYGITV